LAILDSGGDQHLLDPVQLVQLALKRGNARRSLSPGHHTAVDPGCLCDFRTEHDPWRASVLAWRIRTHDNGLLCSDYHGHSSRLVRA
jgi:hypothetical protein